MSYVCISVLIRMSARVLVVAVLSREVAADAKLAGMNYGSWGHAGFGSREPLVTNLCQPVRV